MGAWNMVPRGGLIVDETPAGNDGVPGVGSLVENTILGPFRRYLPNSSANGTALGAANAFPLADVTMAFWYRKDLASVSSDWLVNYFLDGNDAWGPRIVNGTLVHIYDDIDGVDILHYQTTVPRNKLTHVVAVMQSLENLLYIDGVLVGSGEFSTDTWASFAGTLNQGFRTSASAVLNGIIGPLEIYNEAKDQAWVTQQYLKGARAVQFKTDWGYQISIANEGGVTGQPIGGAASPFRAGDAVGRWRVETATIDGQTCKVLTCKTPGNVCIPASYFGMGTTPTEAAYGTWKCWFSKSNLYDVIVSFISEFPVWNAAGNDGYLVAFNSLERVALQYTVAGVTNNLFTSADGYITPDVMYELSITRSFANSFAVYLDGTLVTALTGSNPVTNAATTTGYFVSFYMGVDCKLALADVKGDHCLTKYLGEVAPI
jgi:hypothetical protein